MNVNNNQQEPGRGETPEAPIQAHGLSDPAGKSLADALRVSFFALKLVMIGVIAAWATSGIAFVEPDEIGVIRVFGRIVGQADSGLAYTFPFPIGSIEIVPKEEQVITIEDFWIHETPQDKTKPLARRAAGREGLRAGWDGALLTGDRNLLHMKLACRYKIKDAVACSTNIARPEEVVRTVMCNAATLAGAVETAEGLMKGGRINRLVSKVRELAQERLNALDSGITITQVTVGQGEASWPLQTIPDYERLAAASNRKDQQVNEARGYAQRMLNEAAGERYKVLVGSFESVVGGGGQEPVEDRDGKAGQYDLVGQFIEARRALDHAESMLDEATRAGDKEKIRELSARAAGHRQKARELLDEIDLFMVKEVEGEARKIIDEAIAYNSAVTSRLRSWQEEFEAVLRECPTREARALQMNLQWSDVLWKDILSSRTVEKRFVPAGKVVIRTGGVPSVAKEILMEQAKGPETEEDER